MALCAGSPGMSPALPGLLALLTKIAAASGAGLGIWGGCPPSGQRLWGSPPQLGSPILTLVLVVPLGPLPKVTHRDPPVLSPQLGFFLWVPLAPPNLGFPLLTLCWGSPYSPPVTPPIGVSAMETLTVL